MLQSAEVMKTAVAYLEPHMEKSDDDSGKGRIVLATVKGDVHDIGKNLVDIILSNNGYEVVNIGIKQPIANILEVAEDKSADVVGMSGLLVKSTVVMKENLEEMNTRGVAEKFPVLLGGAALTRSYVENDLAEVYEGEVHYARDAFEGLKLMDTIMSAKRGEAPDTDSPEAPSKRPARRKPSARPATSGPSALPSSARRPRSRSRCPNAPMSPPTSRSPSRRSGVRGSSRASRWPTTPGCSTSAHCSWASGDYAVRAVTTGPSYEDLVETEGRPRLRYWLDRLSTDGILAHAAVVYGYFPAVSEGDDVVVLAEPSPERRSGIGSASRGSSGPVPVHRRLHPVAGLGHRAGPG